MTYVFKFILALTLMAASAVNAGEIKVEQFNHGPEQRAIKIVEFSGEITKGDAQKLATFIAQNRSWVDSINLRSPGGDLREAIMMGEIIKSARIDTVVQPGKVCASACFFIWMNGPDHVMFHNPPPNKKTGLINPSKVGLHRPYLRSISNTEQSISEQANVMRLADNYLSTRLVPRRLIDLMMSRGSNDIYWLTPEDSAELGYTPPDLEELYISHCKDNRKELYRQIDSARANDNASLAAILTGNVTQINSCIGDLNYAARLRAVEGGFKSIIRNN